MKRNASSSFGLASRGRKRAAALWVSRDRVLRHAISTSKALNLSATMASHGDTAEGGANEEFNDIIKWRSGMFESVGFSKMRCRHIAQRCD